MTKAAKKPGRGGARIGAGRIATDGATDLLRTSVVIRHDQRAKLARLGGSAWLRTMIDQEAAK